MSPRNCGALDSSEEQKSSMKTPFLHRKSVECSVLLICFLLIILPWIHTLRLQRSRRAAAAKDALTYLSVDPNVIALLGNPITMKPGIQGEVKEDDTGWQEIRLIIPLRGPHGDAIARLLAVGGWSMELQLFEVNIDKQHKKIDLYQVSQYLTERNLSTYMPSCSAAGVRR